MPFQELHKPERAQLAKMPLKELNALQAKIEAAIAEKRVGERNEIRKKMEELARASGFSAAEPFSGRKGKGSKIAPIATPKTPRRPGPAAAGVRIGWWRPAEI